jgi:hypothetical protein
VLALSHPEFSLPFVSCTRDMLSQLSEKGAGIYKIWRYKKKTIKRRKEAGLPQLFDTDDLPDPEYDPNFVHVLTDEEHHDLHRRTLHHLFFSASTLTSPAEQVKFAYHETWYRPHGTETHRVSAV